MKFNLLLKDRVLRTSNTKHDGLLIPSTLQGTREEGISVRYLWVKDDFNTSSQQLMQKDKLLLKTLRTPEFFCFTDTDV